MNNIRHFIALGAYRTHVEVWSEEGTCYECKWIKRILVFDNSEGEYSPIKFCIDCLKDFHDGKVSKSLSSFDLTEL